MAKKTDLEIVIPIFNEEEELTDSVNRLCRFLKVHLQGRDWHITIADNASTDRSLTIAEKLSRELDNVGVLHLDKKGRGRAVKKAWLKSRAAILCYMDVDLSTDLSALNTLVSSLENGYDIAIGSRLLPESKVVGRTIKREILSRVYNILIRIFFGVGFSDAQCGFKGITRKLADNLIPHLEDNAWFFDSELLIVGEKMGYRVKQIPVIWTDNPGSTVRVLRTVYGDLEGLWRLFWQKPWLKLRAK
ncbi:MAG: glycosyltransferase [Candidatus Gottesmanbacteria bacterium GW2011_GWA2_43_14]|uniref:dolichyl-phosphate beta-glucosyltransferase n=1 Tax=Candidatus Gottesmanbacteria bacterium GW2011_GWA2_43_14 TaxID=1618443 RepID=A0A0G1DM91_9BACT|nr:MAG: glycosyltransferase [Candidatus Gottesmanbacteria bacterium GW2011_GWA2_43_14]